MCGIVGYIGSKKAADILLCGLEKLEYRGYDSAGIATFENGKIEVVKTEGRLLNLENKVNSEFNLEGRCGIGHTRWATHGAPSDINSHPHSSKRVTLVHNGIIENYLELKDFLNKQGYEFLSETDTETVVHLLDYFYNGDPMEAIIKTVNMLKGSYALGILFNDKPETIYAVRKDSPLIIGLGENENFIASDIPAILKHTKRYNLLEAGEIAVIKEEEVKVYDHNLNEIKKNEEVVTWNVEASEKGGFDHFMIKEIHEQPDAIRNTIRPRTIDGLPDFRNENIPDEILTGVKQIKIVACGSAWHAGLVGKHVIESLARTPVEVELASEFRYKNPIITEKDLVIIISQSGETADTLAALRLAKDKGAKTLAIVNVVGSSIAREADYVIYTWAGPEIAVASTKAYSVQVSVMYLIGIKIALMKGTIGEELAKFYQTELLKMPDKIEKILESKENIKEIAKSIYKNSDLFFIGRGIDYATSMEGSLKLKEISYIHSDAYAAGELKHGTIALISEGTPVIALSTQEFIFEKLLSNSKEVKARGAYVICLIKEGMQIDETVADAVITIPETDDIFAPMLSVVPLQIFAYYVAVLKGCDVDKPRNLAKSVTVE